MRTAIYRVRILFRIVIGIRVWFGVRIRLFVFRVGIGVKVGDGTRVLHVDNHASYTNDEVKQFLLECTHVLYFGLSQFNHMQSTRVSLDLGAFVIISRSM